MARFGRRSSGGDDDDYLDDDVGWHRERPEPVVPTRMVGYEPIQGLIVTAALLSVGIANLIDTSGKGAPRHPTTWTTYAGIAIALGLGVACRARSRLVAPFAAIFSAFFLTLSKGPDSLGIPHIVALIVSVGFAILLSVRQRRDQKALGMTSTRRRGRTATTTSTKGRGKAAEPEASRSGGPGGSRRYTPPKAEIEAAKAAKNPRAKTKKSKTPPRTRTSTPRSPRTSTKH